MSVHSFNGDYLSISEGTGSWEYLFHEIPGSSNFYNSFFSGFSSPKFEKVNIYVIYNSIIKIFMWILLWYLSTSFIRKKFKSSNRRNSKTSSRWSSKKWSKSKFNIIFFLYVILCICFGVQVFIVQTIEKKSYFKIPCSNDPTS